MPLYELHGDLHLVAPALVTAFEGWVSAGSVGTATAEHIAEEGDLVASFDSDSLFDYRANRPAAEFLDGILQSVEWPEVALWHKRAGSRDLLVMTGPEPNWRWQALAAEVADLAGRLGVVEQVSLGGIPSAVPHTRPTRLLTTASKPELLDEQEVLPEGVLRVPGAMATIIEHHMVAAGVSAVGFWAQVPHYVAGTYYPGVTTLVERVARHLGAEIPLGSLVDEAAEQRVHLDRLLADQPQAQEYVAKLEEMLAAQSDIPSGEDIAAEIERFLAEAATEDEDPFLEGS